VSGARDLLQSKNRRIRQQFLAEGPQAVSAALAADLVSQVFVVDEFDELAQAAHRAGIRRSIVTEAGLKAMCETVSPQGIVAVCQIPEVSLEEVLTPLTGFVVVCVGVSDPGNLGTIIRTAAAAGARAVITTTGSADLWSGKVVRSTVGTFAAVAVTGPLDEDTVLTALSSRSITTVAAAGQSEVSIFGAEIAAATAGPHAWLLGSEAHGLSDQTLNQVDVVATIPMAANVESLNVASAAAICLYASRLRHVVA